MNSEVGPTYRHPEIEQSDHNTLKTVLKKHASPVDTLVDVLEIGRGKERSDGRRRFSHQDLVDVSHEDLVAYLEKTKAQARKPPLRIIFLKDAQIKEGATRLGASVDNRRVCLSYDTIEYFVTTLGVCPVFISTITTVPWLLGTGNALFKTYDSEMYQNSSLSCVQGFFRYSDRGLPAHVWFQHNIAEQTSTYMIQGCPDRVKETIMTWAKTTAVDNLLRPLAIETLILDEVSWEWSKAVVEASKRLLEYELLSGQENAERIDTAVHSLHNLSQHFHILQEEMHGIVEQLDYLLDVHRILESACFNIRPKHRSLHMTSANAPMTSTADSLLFLRSRTHNWHRWLGNWKERTEVRIHLFFNLAAQRDNGINAKIAQLTTQIAKETSKDSSSMTTIAILTLFFLPGTFITAIFSMPLMQINDHNLALRIYIGIAIALTFAVGMLWNWWRLHRNNKAVDIHVDEFSRPLYRLDSPQYVPPEGPRHYPTRPPSPVIIMPPQTVPIGLNSHFDNQRSVEIKVAPRTPVIVPSIPPSPLNPPAPRKDQPKHISLALSDALSRASPNMPWDTSHGTSKADHDPHNNARLDSRIRSRAPSPVPSADEDGKESFHTAASDQSQHISSQTSSESFVQVSLPLKTKSRSIFDPNAAPFIGYGMWAPDASRAADAGIVLSAAPRLPDLFQTEATVEADPKSYDPLLRQPLLYPLRCTRHRSRKSSFHLAVEVEAAVAVAHGKIFHTDQRHIAPAEEVLNEGCTPSSYRPQRGTAVVILEMAGHNRSSYGLQKGAAVVAPE